MSHIQIASNKSLIFASKIGVGEADVILGFDEIVTASDAVLSRVKLGKTVGIINASRSPTADFILDPKWSYPDKSVASDLTEAFGCSHHSIPATGLARFLLGNALYANPLLLGYAWQTGLIPLSKKAILEAIRINNVDIETNILAFEWGRAFAHDPSLLSKIDYKKEPVTSVGLNSIEELSEIVQSRSALLRDYQDQAYADDYLTLVDQVKACEDRVDQSLKLTKAVAKNLAKFMAYKDEYEVARLHTSKQFRQYLESQFEGVPGVDYKLNYHFAPPVVARKNHQGVAVKSQYGQWLKPVLNGLKTMKFLRQFRFDPFGLTSDRRQEKQLLQDYLSLITIIKANLTGNNLEVAVALASLPDEVRGFGHVKDRTVEVYQEKRRELLDQFLAPREESCSVNSSAEPAVQFEK